MSKTVFLSTVFAALIILSVSCTSTVKVRQNGDMVIIRNEMVGLEFNLDSGTYSIRNLLNNTIPVKDAFLKINNWSSDTEGCKITWEKQPVPDEIGHGMALELRVASDHQPVMIFSFMLYEDHGHVVVSGGIENTTSQPVWVKEIHALAGGQVYEGLDISENFAMIDGFSGGEPLEYGRRLYSPLTRENALKSRNNLLLTFGGDDLRHTLVMGGLTYHDFEKFATLAQSRRIELEQGADHAGSLLCYLNLPDDSVDEAESGEMIELVRGAQKQTWQNHEFRCLETATSAMDENSIILEINNLDQGKPYYLGFSWWRGFRHGDRKDHRQSVFIEYMRGGEMVRLPVVESQMLPRFDGVRKEDVEQVELPIPVEAIQSGGFRLVVEHPPAVYENSAGDPNVYLNEVWLRDGTGKPLLSDQLTQIHECPRPKRQFDAHLFAADPVGKKVDPGVRYIPEDMFYIDVTTVCPFEALELYGRTVGKSQKIELNMYDFPTVCLWYAEHTGYGGGGAENSTPGAVREMGIIKDSGFLRYSRAAVRLVPDSYLPDNQQGWWDDAHWQREGDRDASMNGQYLEPYETSEKWGKAVTDLGGIPLTYFQTSYRSEDYAKAFPEHMLFNKTYAWKGEPQDTTGEIFTSWRNTWVRNGRYLWGYDYTDPGFLDHLERVYANLRSGGIKGLMFDYPASGWARSGGMEDEYSTTAAAYRTIFRIPHEGLGPESYVHERNMERGTDVSIGFVASMRTENDTDKFDVITATRCGMRWYKNRTLYNQDTDSKNLVRIEDNRDDVRTVLTMAYVTTGRLLLANSFSEYADETFHDLTRTYPYHTTNKSARPVDAFISEYPMVYDYKINEQWHQVTFFNTDVQNPKTVSIDLAGNAVNGALGLDAKYAYHVYDFWNDNYIGKIDGSSSLQQTLRAGESRMMSVRRVLDHPQLLSTNRHIMQGYLDVDNVQWDKRSRTLSGTSRVIGDDAYVITIASNGLEAASAASSDPEIKISITSAGGKTQQITIESPENRSVNWMITYEK